MVKSSEGKMPEVTCLGILCGKIIKFPSHIKPEKYDGQARCQECKSLMHIKLEKSVVVRHSLVEDKSESTEGWKTWAELHAELEKPDDETK